MSDADGAAGGPTLRARPPAFPLLHEFVRRQDAELPRGHAARMLGRSPLQPHTVTGYRAALGELEVVAALTQLGSGWTVLNAVPMAAAASDIDHVVIGPGGVFTVSVEHHPRERIWVRGGTLLAGGQTTPHVRDALREADRAARRLGAAADAPVTVTPVIVVIDAASITHLDSLVTVVRASELHRWLSRRPRVLLSAEVDRLSAVAERPLTWGDCPMTGETVDEAAVQSCERFARLRAEVGRSRARARVWMGACSVATVAAVAAVAAFVGGLPADGI